MTDYNILTRKDLFEKPMALCIDCGRPQRPEWLNSKGLCLRCTPSK